MTEPSQYGRGDATYIAAGGETGVRRIVDQFYDLMSSEPEYRTIWDWHTDKQTSRDKLARFLCGWMGGPAFYREAYGPINIPKSHMHLRITEVERDQWLGCMRRALNALEYPADFIEYLMGQLKVPAERIRVSSWQMGG